MVTQYVDQPPFMEMILQRIASEPSHSGHLFNLLAEAGLSSIYVAETLFRRKPISPIPSTGLASPSWLSSKLIEGTLLGECLAVACSGSGPTSPLLPLVNKFSQIPLAFCTKLSRSVFIIAKYFGLYLISCYLLCTAMCTYIFELLDRKWLFARSFDVDTIGDNHIFTVFNSAMMFTVLTGSLIFLLCLLPFIQFRYVILYYYNCLNLYNMNNVTSRPRTINLLLFPGIFAFPKRSPNLRQNKLVARIIMIISGRKRISVMNEFLCAREKNNNVLVK